MKTILLTATLLLAAATAPAAKQAPAITGDYVEIRTCDVFTGPCFANSQMNLEGREAILVWAVKEGSWNHVKLDGLKVIAVVRSDVTLGDVHYNPASGKAVLIVDSGATESQRTALTDMARSMSGGLIGEVVETKSTGIEAAINACPNAGCASVKAGDLVRIETRCFGEHDHFCGNESDYYPPLTRLASSRSAFTELASYNGSGLNLKFEAVDQRSAFVGRFSR